MVTGAKFRAVPGVCHNRTASNGGALDLHEHSGYVALGPEAADGVGFHFWLPLPCGRLAATAAGPPQHLRHTGLGNGSLVPNLVGARGGPLMSIVGAFECTAASSRSSTWIAGRGGAGGRRDYPASGRAGGHRRGAGEEAARRPHADVKVRGVHGAHLGHVRPILVRSPPRSRRSGPRPRRSRYRLPAIPRVRAVHAVRRA
jgi:hypothetical protein